MGVSVKRTQDGLSLFTMVSVLTGTTIGMGVFAFIPVCVNLTGYSAWLAYAVACLLAASFILPVMWVVSALKIKGAEYGIVSSFASRRLTGMYSVAGLLHPLGMATYGITVGTYLSAYFPSVNATVVAAAVTIIFFLINMFGVNIMGKVQNLLVIILIAGMLLFIALGIGKINQPIFSFGDEEFFKGGAFGFTRSVTYLYSTFSVGIISACAYCYDAKDSKKTLPKAMLITMAVVFVVYMVFTWTSTGVLGIAEVANNTFVNVIRHVMPGALAPIFIFLGPVCAIVSSLNGVFVSYRRPLERASDNKWLPSTLGRKNRYGVSWIYMIYLFVLAMFPILSGYSLSALLSNLNVLTGLMRLAMCIALFRFPKLFPEAWAASKYHVPDGVYYAVCAVGVAFQLLIIVMGALTITTTQLVLNLIFIALTAGYGFFRAKSPDVVVTNNAEA